MIKNYIFLIAILFIGHSSLAQITGGGRQQTQTQQSAPRQKASSNGYKAAYISLAAPSGNFKSQGPASTGFALGVANHLQIYELDPTMEIGLFHGLVMQLNPLDDASEALPVESTYVPYFFIEYKLGPSFNYKPNDDTNLTGYFRLGPVLGLGPDYEDGFTNVYNDGAAFGIRTALGFNVSWTKLFGQFEISPGKLEYSFYDSATGTTFDQDVSIGSIRLGIGVTF